MSQSMTFLPFPARHQVMISARKRVLAVLCTYSNNLTKSLTFVPSRWLAIELCPKAWLETELSSRRLTGGDRLHRSLTIFPFMMRLGIRAIAG
ncbi:hypothetical protein BaRGS_00008277 [Batillaria attramentaria]|uniref:Uncharacterized protein n=1 Tax=Batillaria attramentaria TaxID=370345 RepID=A0ABD0LM25_9CAEN